MKSNFLVVWIDDNTTFIDSLRDWLELHLESRGYGLDLHPYEARDDSLLNSLATNNVDLILIDYNLGDEKGDSLIQEIRRRGNYQEILFYTQGSIPPNVRQIGLEGVFYASRTDVKDHIKALVELKVKRASDLAMMRGWIVADSIELEFMVEDLILLFFCDCEDNFLEHVLRKDNLYDFGKKVATLQSLLRSAIAERNSQQNSPDMKELQQCKEVLNRFDDEVIHIRNAVAHQRAEESKSGAPKIPRLKGRDKSPIVVNDDTCIQFRKNFRKHYSNLEKLKRLIQSMSLWQSLDSDAA